MSVAIATMHDSIASMGASSRAALIEEGIAWPVELIARQDSLEFQPGERYAQ